VVLTPGLSETVVKGRGVDFKPGHSAIADRAIADRGAALVGRQVVQQRASVVQALDRSREAELAALRRKEQQVKPVENIHSLEAMLARARDDIKKPTDLAQLRAVSDQFAGRIAEMDQSGRQWADQADEDAVRLGLRLNQLVDGPEVDQKMIKKVIDEQPLGAPRLILSIREVFNYIRLKYPTDPLNVSVLKVMHEFARELGFFKAADKRLTRASENVRYMRALAGVMLTRLIQKGIGELLDRLFEKKGGDE